MSTKFQRLLIPATAIVLVTTTLATAETPTCENLEEWVPGDVIAFARVDGLGARVDDLLGSSLRKDLEATRLGQYLLAHEKYGEFEKQLSWFREATGKDALDVAKDLLGTEVVVAVRLTFIGIPEVIVVSRTPSVERLTSARKALEKAVETAAGAVPETGKSEYRGHVVETLGQGHVAYVGPVVIVSNSKGMIEASLDLVAGESKRSIAASSTFSKVARKRADHSFIQAAVRPRFIPNFKIPDKLDNPVGSLLIGGLAGALRVSEVVGVSVDVAKDGVVLRSVTVPDDRGIDDRFDSFFPQIASDGLEKRLRKSGLLGFINVHRDLAGWWERAEDLLDVRSGGNLTEFSGNLSLFFGGKSFQDEVLPKIGETITFVAMNQTYESVGSKPKPAIPGFAALFQLRDAENFGRDFKVAFNSIVGIINVTRMQQKPDSPSMLVAPKLVGKTECYTVDMGLKPAKDQKLGIEYNFTPSMAVVGDRVILSSSFELLDLLVKELDAIGEEKQGSEGKKGSGKTVVKKGAKDRLRLDLGAGVAIARDNRDFFASQRMVEEGIELDEARQQVDAFLEIAAFLRDLEIATYREGDNCHLDIRLRLAKDRDRSEPAKSSTKTAAVKK